MGMEVGWGWSVARNMTGVVRTSHAFDVPDKDEEREVGVMHGGEGEGNAIRRSSIVLPHVARQVSDAGDEEGGGGKEYE